MPSFLLTVNGTEREVALPTLSVQHVVNGPDILEGDIQDELGSVTLNMDDLLVLTRTDVSPQTVYFEGLLQTTGNETWTGYGYSRLRRITAFDYGIYASFVQVQALTISAGSPADSVSAFLQTLVTDYLTDYGVTVHPSQATGPSIEPNAFDGQTTEAVLNAVSEQTGWVWKIDALKRIEMWDPATRSAGFNVTATNGTYIGDVSTNILRQRYYNRVFVEGGNGYHTFTGEVHYGDGAAITFPMNAPMHYFEVDYTATLGFIIGLTLLVTRTGGTTVEYANDQLTAQWTFNPGPEYSLTQVSGAVLGPTEYLTIPGYAAQYPMRLVADGRGSPPAPARDLKLVRPSMFGRAALESLAATVLAASQVNFERISYLTDEVGILPGETQTVNVPEAGVNDTYTAISVRLSYVSGGDTSAFRREVTAVNAVTARSFWLNLYQRWLTDNQGVSSSAALAGTVIPQGPAGLDQEVQSNGAGVFAADASFKHDRTAKSVTVEDADSKIVLLGLDVDANSTSLEITKHSNSHVLKLLDSATPADTLYADFSGGQFSIYRFGAVAGSTTPGISITDNDEAVHIYARGISLYTLTGVSNNEHILLAGLTSVEALSPYTFQLTGTSYTLSITAAVGTCYSITPTGNFTFNLAALSAFAVSPVGGAGWRRLIFVRNNSATYTVTIDPNGAETINGVATYVLQPGQSAVIGATSNDWKVYADSGGSPAAHATTHQQGGSDPIKLDDLATPDDNTDLNASTTRHGLLQKLPNNSAVFLDGLGNFTDPGTGSGTGNVTDTTPIGSEPAGSPGPNAGDLVLYNNSHKLARYDGASLWVPWGPIFPLTEPIDGDFAWINQGSGSVSTANGGIYGLTPANATDDFKIRKKAAPSTPYTITVAFLLNMLNVADQVGGLCFRQSSDGKLVVAGYGTSGSIGYHVWKYNTPTSFSASYLDVAASYFGVVWIRIADNGTNRITSISQDGSNFLQIHSIGRTDFLTADEVGWCWQSSNATYPAGMTLISWKET